MVVASMSILGMLLPSFRNLGRIYEYWHSYRVALERIHYFMNTPELIVDQEDAQRLRVKKGKIEFKNIHLEAIFPPRWPFDNGSVNYVLYSLAIMVNQGLQFP
jgi:ABC-type multidrug transport system fused ATPase/permease subunit